MRNVTLLLLLTCSTALTTFAGKPNKPTGNSTISLQVTVNPFQQSGTPTVIQSDGQGTYSDGQGGVCATIASTGVLTIAFDCKSVSFPRRLSFASFPTSPLAPPSSGTYGCSATQSTFTPPYTNRIGAGPDQGGTAFQAMTVDPTGSPLCVQVFIATQLSTSSGTTTAYRLDYDYPVEFSDGALASPAQVRRLSATEWVVESRANFVDVLGWFTQRRDVGRANDYQTLIPHQRVWILPGAVQLHARSEVASLSVDSSPAHRNSKWAGANVIESLKHRRWFDGVRSLGPREGNLRQRARPISRRPRRVCPRSLSRGRRSSSGRPEVAGRP